LRVFFLIQIIAGSKDSNKLEAWMFPQELRNQVKEAKHRWRGSHNTL